MDHSVCNMKAILAVAVLAMAAFAGVMMVGDDADAADSEGYTITYSYNGITAQEKTDADGKIAVKTFKTDVLQSANVPAGYKFDYWVSGSAVYSADKDGSMTTFMGDATLVPHFTPVKSIVKLAYGDKSKEYVNEASNEAYPIVLKDLKDFAEIIGAKVVKADGTVIDGSVAEISEGMGLYIEGYEFKGFFKADDTKVEIDKLKGAEASVTTFTAVFEKVYGVSFIVEGASVLETTSDKITVADKIATGDVPVAPAKANHIFMGWYNAAGEPVFAYSSDLKQYSVSSETFKIVEDTTLYAKFVPVTFTVTFVYGEDRAVFATETVKYGDLAIEPKGLPEGYKGWDWNFGVPIEADTEIPAIVADPVTVYTVTFEIDGKAPVTQRSDSMVLPDTAIEGKVFQGWVVKGESQYVSPMNYAITGDITFVAVYKEADPPAGPSFFQTTEGKCVAVLIAVVIIAFIYAVYSNMFGLKDALTSVKITRVKK